MKCFTTALLTLTFAVSAPAFATVLVSNPSNGESVGSNVQFVATANTTTCSKGVASMGVYIDGKIEYVHNGMSLNTNLSLASGTHRAVVQEWDYCGGSTSSSLGLSVSSAAGVSVSSPISGSTVSSPAAYLATANTSCSSGVAATGVYVDNNLTYVAQGAKLNTQLTMSGGSHKTVVQAWDNCGGTSSKQVDVTVGGGGGKNLYNLQASGGWNQWGELAPNYGICSYCNGQVTWSMYQHNRSVSLDGNSTQFNLGGSTPYSDVLWSNPVIGQGSTQGLPDYNHTILPAVHNFTLDTYVFVTNLSVTQDLEFDINWYMNSVGIEFGTQCNHLADGSWDIWDNVHAHWFSSGIPCQLNNAAWNHVVVQVQREPNNDLLYQSITVNGVVHNINKTVPPFWVPGGWYGMTVNYQMDGNHTQSPYTTYVDKMTLTYW
jgi:hypothetical protein